MLALIINDNTGEKKKKKNRLPACEEHKWEVNMKNGNISKRVVTVRFHNWAIWGFNWDERVIEN